MPSAHNFLCKQWLLSLLLICGVATIQCYGDVNGYTTLCWRAYGSSPSSPYCSGLQGTPTSNQDFTQNPIITPSSSGNQTFTGSASASVLRDSWIWKLSLKINVMNYRRDMYVADASGANAPGIAGGYMTDKITVSGGTGSYSATLTFANQGSLTSSDPDLFSTVICASIKMVPGTTTHSGCPAGTAPGEYNGNLPTGEFTVTYPQLPFDSPVALDINLFALGVIRPLLSSEVATLGGEIINGGLTVDDTFHLTNVKITDANGDPIRNVIINSDNGYNYPLDPVNVGGLILKLAKPDIISPKVDAEVYGGVPYSTPTEAGKTTVTVTAYNGNLPVTNCLQPPMPSIKVSLEAANVPINHFHLSSGPFDNTILLPARPTIKQDPCDDKSGRALIQVAITAGELAFEATVVATADGVAGVSVPLAIAVEGLQPLPVAGSPLFQSVADVSGIRSHPNGFSGTPEMNKFLNQTAKAIQENEKNYLTTCPQVLPMNIQGISLPNGGLFDIHWDFQRPHKYHRIGIDVDLAVNQFDVLSFAKTCKSILYHALRQAADPNNRLRIFPVKDESPQTPNANHWHVVPYPAPLTSPSLMVAAPSWQSRKLTHNVLATSQSDAAVSGQVAVGSGRGPYGYFYSISNGTPTPLDGFSVQFDQVMIVPRNPTGWASGAAGNSQGWYWGAIDVGADVDDSRDIPLGTSAIQPGTSLTGFSVASSLPPTIRSFNLLPFVDVPVLNSEDDIETLPPPVPPITGFTIGPRTTTALTPQAYVDDIIQLNQRAFALGWIDDSGLLDSLDQKLQAIKQALSKGANKEAVDTLTTFMQEVEAQQGTHLTSEAYALLFFNAQYLRDHNIRVITATRSIITTVAGTGVRGFSGDGGPGTSAQLANPGKLATDRNGNLFILDIANHRVRRLDHATGVLTTVAGNGTINYSGDGRLATDSGMNPQDIAVDAAGNLYIAEGGTLRKVDPAGTITTVFGTFPGGQIAIDPSGNFYVAANTKVLRIDTAGNITTIAGTGALCCSGDGGPAISAHIYARDIALDGTGNIYIEDDRSVRKIDPSGIITRVAGTGKSGVGSGDGGPALNAEIDASGFTVDAQGNLYIVGSEALREVDSSGVIRTVAGTIGAYGFSGDGGPADRAKLYAPLAATIDGAGNLYIADLGNQRIRRVSPNPINSLTFQIVPGANNPPNQSFDINTSGGESWTAKIPGPCDLWMSIAPSSTTGSTKASVNAYMIGLAPGTYQCTINVQGTQGESVTVPVTLVVQSPIPLAGGKWMPFGPYAHSDFTESSGRVTALAVDPRDSNVVYAGPQGGGVWKTTNGGVSWIPITDAVGGGGFAITFITIDPNNPDTVYAGGGSTGDYSTFLKTTDGGKTWKARTGLTPGYFILALAVSSADSKRLLAGTDQGIFLSTDAGETWRSVLKGPITNSVFFDKDPSTAYAGSSDWLGGTPVGIFRSTDSGETWTNVTSNFFPSDSVAFHLRMGLDNSAVLYAGVERYSRMAHPGVENYSDMAGTALSALYKSTDHGKTWNHVNCAPSCPSWVWLFEVDPLDSSYLLGGTTGLMRSLDGGLTWSDFTGGKTITIHVDQHAAAFSHDGKTLYIANDGGVWSTSDPKAQSFDWRPLNSTLAISEIYGIAVHPSDPNRVFVGVQDSGILRDVGSPKWESVACGDGFSPAFDAIDPSIVYVTCSEPQVSHNGGNAGTFQEALTGIDVNEGWPSFQSHIVADPSRSQVVYFTSNHHVYQSINGAATWTAISPSFQSVNAIAVSPIDSNVVFAGTLSGEIFRTSNALNGGASIWARVGSADGPITAIAIDPRDGKTVFATVDGYQSIHILKSMDGGSSFIAAKANFPDTRAYTIIFDPDLRDTIYLGAEHGAFGTTDGGNSWGPVGTGLPRPVVAQLAFHRSTRTLYAATYGRSVWTLAIPIPPPPGRVPFSITDRGGLSVASTGAGAAATVGYASIHATTSSTAPSSLAIFGSRNANGILVSEATVASSPAVQSGRIYVEVNTTVNTGLAIANPNGTTANISFYFTDQHGTDFGAGKLVISANGQKAAFLDQPPFNGGPSINGTFTFMSDIPVAAIALRGLTNERSELLWTTLPVSPLAANTASVVLPTFANGEGWTTQFVLVNPTDKPMTGTLQFYDQGSPNTPGRASTVTLEGQADSTFSYSIPARSSLTRKTSGTTGSIQLGSVRVVPDGNSQTPAGLGIFSFKNTDGITVSEAGVPATIPAQALRLYAEATSDSSRIQTGIALANTSAIAATVTLDLYTLAGLSTGLTGTVTVPASGQIQTFLNQVHGFENIPTPFEGILRISTTAIAGVSVLGLRSRNNERQEFIVTTLTPVNENSTPTSGDLLFPHLADGGGFTTQFILFSTVPGQTASGFMQFYSQGGQALNLTLR
jgi:photosystem II stability/assembly factor-like uncharacterized protein